MNKYYPGEKFVNYHQKRVMVNYQYFIDNEEQVLTIYFLLESGEMVAYTDIFTETHNSRKTHKRRY